MSVRSMLKVWAVAAFALLVWGVTFASTRALLCDQKVIREFEAKENPTRS